MAKFGMSNIKEQISKKVGINPNPNKEAKKLAGVRRVRIRKSVNMSPKKIKPSI